MPAMKLSLAVAATICSLVSGFVARPGPLSQQFSAASTSLHRPAARSASSGLAMMAEGTVFDTEGALDWMLERNQQWASEQNPELFERLKDSQAPKYLYIGCSDSRVPAENMLKLNPGELFVHRNVANLCLTHDISLNSVVKYAVEVLGVTDIIVCGHYQCGGVKASTLNVDHGLLEHWLYAIRNVQRIHKDELAAIQDADERFKRLVELNVKESCFNLFSNPIVQKKQAEAAQPRIHGWVYDVGTGLLKDLNIDFKEQVKKYKDIYGMYDLPSLDEETTGNLPAMTPRKAAAAPAEEPAAVNGSAEVDTQSFVNGSAAAEEAAAPEPEPEPVAAAAEPALPHRKNWWY